MSLEFGENGYEELQLLVNDMTTSGKLNNLEAELLSYAVDNGTFLSCVFLFLFNPYIDVVFMIYYEQRL